MIGEHIPIFTTNITYKAFFLSLLMFTLIFFYGIECYVRDGGIAPIHIEVIMDIAAEGKLLGIYYEPYLHLTIHMHPTASYKHACMVRSYNE